MALLGLGNCLEPLPTRREIEMSINRTIDEVERMVSADPSLPRLSRSEIVDILFNITSSDMDSYNDHIEKTREDYQRALMVVLPYSTKDSRNDSLNDLFTKPPHFRILSDSSASPETVKTQSLKSPVSSSSNSINRDTKKSEDRSNESANHYKNHRDTYSEVSAEPPTEQALRQLLTKDKKQDQAPQKFTFNLANFDSSNRPSSTSLPTLKNVLRNRETTPSRSSLEIVYSTSVTESPITTKMIVHTTELSPAKYGPTMPPTRSTQNVLTSDQWHYNAPPSTTTARPKRPTPEVIRSNQRPTSHHFLPTVVTASDETVSTSATHKSKTTTPNLVVDLRKNQKSQFDMANLRIVNENEKPAPFYVTPMSSTSGDNLEDSMTTANTPEISKTTTPMREEVQTLLASIGLRPEEKPSDHKKPNEVKDEQDKIFGTNFQIPESNDVVRHQLPGLEAVEVESPSKNQPALDNAPQDVRLGASNLSPEVQLLFQRFGLQTSDKEAEVVRSTTTVKPRPATGKTGFWNSFKPIPASEVRDESMKDFLAKFGLGTANRNEKRMKERKSVEDDRPSLIEAVPGNMRQILENIGLVRKPQKPVVPKIIEETTLTPQLHIFKPHETSLDNEKQRSKINALLDTVKQVQEGKADAVAVQKAAKELLETTKSLKNGPDPLSLEEILKIYNDDLKNEIKRQQNPKDLAEMATSGIKRLMIYALGSSELWIGRIIGGLTSVKNVLTNVTNKLRLSHDAASEHSS